MHRVDRVHHSLQRLLTRQRRRVLALQCVHEQVQLGAHGLHRAVQHRAQLRGQQLRVGPRAVARRLQHPGHRVGQRLQLGHGVDVDAGPRVHHVAQQRGFSRAVDAGDAHRGEILARRPERGVVRHPVGGVQHLRVGADDGLDFGRRVGLPRQQQRHGTVDGVEVRLGDARHPSILVGGNGRREGWRLPALVGSDQGQCVGRRLSRCPEHLVQLGQRVHAARRRTANGVEDGWQVVVGHDRRVDAQKFDLRLRRRRTGAQGGSHHRGHRVGQRLQFGHGVNVGDRLGNDHVAQQRHLGHGVDAGDTQGRVVGGRRQRHGVARRGVGRGEHPHVGGDDPLDLCDGVGRVRGEARHRVVHRRQVGRGDTVHAGSGVGLLLRRQRLALRTVIGTDDGERVRGRLRGAANERIQLGEGIDIAGLDVAQGPQDGRQVVRGDHGGIDHAQQFDLLRRRPGLLGIGRPHHRGHRVGQRLQLGA